MIKDCDSRQIGRALLNLLQNATDSIQARLAAEGPDSAPEPPPGVIAVKLDEQDGRRVISVEDNGCGLPRAKRHRLTEPYVTTRTRGTGLGLAIVHKIMEDHGGRVLLEDRSGGGARVSLVFSTSEAPGLARGEHPADAAEREDP